ncbi:E6 [Macaca fascicularis papillomavirus 1]|uniref:Protein E6 n=1 Tax=Macaca fascicularis papillomavirus 1 TaxID=2847841 RepID=A2T933_9PAPI|nr:E6 [Macaca fascicularis papillomavirus 1]
MAIKPQTGSALAALLGLQLQELSLPCNFCGNFLSVSELLELEEKGLQLIWKGDFVYGCCRCCCVATATYECMAFLEDTILGSDIEEREGKPIAEISIRCQNCLRRLDLIDKLDIVGRNELFHKVRGRWKGLCRQCKTL